MAFFGHNVFSASTCEPLLEKDLTDGFTIRSEDVALNPNERLMLMGGRTLKLSRSEYLVMELLILAQGAVVPFEEFQEEALREAELRGRRDSEYKRNWLNQCTFHLRKKLKSAFGDEVSQRLITLNSRGLAWAIPSLIEQSKSFDPDKVTYVTDKQRVFVGEKEILLNPHFWSMFSSFVEKKKEKVSADELKSIWWVRTHEEVNEEFFRVYFFRLNSVFREALGSKSVKVFTPAREGKKWQINTSLIEYYESSL